MQPGAENTTGRAARDQPRKPVCQLSGLSAQGTWIPLTGSALGVRSVNPLRAKAGWQAARRAAPHCTSVAESCIWTTAGVHTPQLLQTKSGRGSFHHLRLPGVHKPRLNFHRELEEEQAPADELEGLGKGGGSSGPRPGWAGGGVRPHKHARVPEGTAARMALTWGSLHVENSRSPRNLHYFHDWLKAQHTVFAGSGSCGEPRTAPKSSAL